MQPEIYHKVSLDLFLGISSVFHPEVFHTVLPNLLNKSPKLAIFLGYLLKLLQESLSFYGDPSLFMVTLEQQVSSEVTHAFVSKKS